MTPKQILEVLVECEKTDNTDIILDIIHPIVKNREASKSLNIYNTNWVWSIDDVKRNYNCTDAQAMKVLDRLANDEWIGEQVNHSIAEIADSLNLKPIDDE